MHQHVKVLAWLNIVYGGLGILFSLIIFIVMGGVAGFVSQFDPSVDAQTAAPIIVVVGTFVVVVLLVVSAPSVIAGMGLLAYKPWARTLTIVLSALHLLSVPFGTALGVYGLWVLLQPSTEALFSQFPPPAPRPYS